MQREYTVGLRKGFMLVDWQYSRCSPTYHHTRSEQRIVLRVVISGSDCDLLAFVSVVLGGYDKSSLTEQART